NRALANRDEREKHAARARRATPVDPGGVYANRRASGAPRHAVALQGGTHAVDLWCGQLGCRGSARRERRAGGGGGGRGGGAGGVGWGWEWADSSSSWC